MHLYFSKYFIKKYSLAKLLVHLQINIYQSRLINSNYCLINPQTALSTIYNGTLIIKCYANPKSIWSKHRTIKMLCSLVSLYFRYEDTGDSAS